MRSKWKCDTHKISAKKVQCTRNKSTTSSSSAEEESDSIEEQLQHQHITEVRDDKILDMTYALFKSSFIYSTNSQISQDHDQQQMLNDSVMHKLDCAEITDKNAKNIALRELCSFCEYKKATRFKQDVMMKKIINKMNMKWYNLEISSKCFFILIITSNALFLIEVIEKYLIKQKDIEVHRELQRAEIQEEKNCALLFQEAYTKWLMSNTEQSVNIDIIVVKYLLIFCLKQTSTKSWTRLIRHERITWLLLSNIRSASLICKKSKSWLQQMISTQTRQCVVFNLRLWTQSTLNVRIMSKTSEIYTSIWHIILMHCSNVIDDTDITIDTFCTLLLSNQIKKIKVLLQDCKLMLR